MAQSKQKQNKMSKENMNNFSTAFLPHGTNVTGTKLDAPDVKDVGTALGETVGLLRVETLGTNVTGTKLDAPDVKDVGTTLGETVGLLRVETLGTNVTGTKLDAPDGKDVGTTLGETVGMLGCVTETDINDTASLNRTFASYQLGEKLFYGSNDVLKLIDEDNQYFHTAHNVVMSIVKKEESAIVSKIKNQMRENLVNFWYPKIKSACQDKEVDEVDEIIFLKCYQMKEILTTTIINEVSVYLISLIDLYVFITTSIL